MSENSSTPDETLTLRALDRAVETLIRLGWKQREIRSYCSSSVTQAWAVMRPDPDPTLFDLTEAP